jgi:hypothetical protein
MNIKQKKIGGVLLVMSLILVLALPIAVSAAENTTYTLLAPLPCIEGNGVTCGGSGTLLKEATFQGYVQYAFNLFIAIAAVAAVFMTVYGGFL